MARIVNESSEGLSVRMFSGSSMSWDDFECGYSMHQGKCPLGRIFSGVGWARVYLQLLVGSILRRNPTS